jgi:hypothetical protein
LGAECGGERGVGTAAVAGRFGQIGFQYYEPPMWPMAAPGGLGVPAAREEGLVWGDPMVASKHHRPVDQEVGPG